MIRWIGIDADDTLWHHEKYFLEAKRELFELLKNCCSESLLLEHLEQVQAANLEIFGYGVKSFTLSSVELALRASQGRVDNAVVAQIIDLGKGLMTHSIEPLPGVIETLTALALEYRLLLITKGDLFHQEAKIEKSGLSHFFERIEIVSEKSETSYQNVFSKYGVSVGEFVMVGNSLRSDILPVVKLGAHAIHIPSEYEWSLDVVQPEVMSEWHYHRLKNIRETVSCVKGL